MADRASYHVPVLKDEVLRLLGPGSAAGGLYFDGTVGGGGHALALLEGLPDCRLLAVDRDPAALNEAARRLEPFADRIHFVHARYDRALEVAGVESGTLAGALLDLGVSSHQLDDDVRGFGFRKAVPLDMRMDNGEDSPTAAHLLNEAPAEELARIFFQYGEERRSRRLAAEVVRRREKAPLESSDDVVAALTVVLRRPPRAGEKARIFQALRIAVNAELESLELALPLLRDALVPSGVLVVIAYHSLEDRMVKVSFRDWSTGCTCPPEIPFCACGGVALGEVLTRKPIRPGEEEVERNPRARSARLRAWKRAA